QDCPNRFQAISSITWSKKLSVYDTRGPIEPVSDIKLIRTDTTL
ncbi:Uncharacterized protein APZ42_006569, partial [Daphnia magna]